MKIIHIIGILIVFACTASLADEKNNNQPKGLVSPSDKFSLENNELIVALLLRKNLPLSDGIIAYAKGNDIALPFEQLMFLLEFPIRTSNKGKQAKGWFIRKNRQFSLSLDSGKVLSNGRAFKIQASDMLVVNNELFVPTHLLSKWFPIDFKANLRALDVVITPRETLAIDDRIERKNKKHGVTYQIRANRPEHKTSYKVFTVPAFQLNFGVGYSENNNKLSKTYSVRATSDFAFMHSDLFLVGTGEKLSDGRIILSRQDPRGRLLGKLNATAIELGDINSPSASLIHKSFSGRGLRIKRKPAGYVGGLEKITLDGSVEIGYDVELYRNNILIASIQSSSSTHYKFEDIKLFGGQNEFRIEFYGKQGQRRTEVKHYSVGAGQVKTGELLYDISISQANKTVFGVHKPVTDKKNKLNNGVNVSAIFDYGYSPNLTFNVGASFYSDKKNANGSANYGFGGIRTRLDNFSINFDAAVKNTGSYALGLSATSKFSDVDISLNHESYFDGFKKNATASNNIYLTSNTGIDMRSDAIKLTDGIFLGAGVGISASTNNGGYTSYRVNNDLSLRISRTNFTNNLSYSYSKQTDKELLSGSSRLNLNIKSLGSVGIRAAANYDIFPKRGLKSFNVGISKTYADSYSASLRYDKDLSEDSRSVTVSLSKKFKPVSVSLSVSKRSSRNMIENKRKEDTAAFLTFSLNTFTDSKSFKTHFSNPQNTNNSGVRAKVFLDENNNNLFDIDETLVEGVGVLGFGRKKAITNKKGEALLEGSSSGDWQDIYLDTESLSDPSWRAGSTGFAVLSRGGRITELNFPVIVTSDIEGTVMLLKEDGSSRPLGNINIQALKTNLTSGKKEVVAQVVTSYDGFYSLSGVPLGDILLRISPSQASRLAVTQGAVKQLHTNEKTKLLSDQNFSLSR